MIILAAFGLIYLVWKLYMLTIPILIAAPLLSYYFVRNKKALLGFNTWQCANFFWAAAIISAAIMYGKRDSVMFTSAESFVEGKIVEKEFINEGENGEEFEETRQIYVPETKKGKNLMRVLEFGFIILVVASNIICFKLIPPKPYKLRHNSEQEYDDDGDDDE